MIFSYTSGTTGDSKGVKISHRHLLISVAGGLKQLDLDDSLIFISYLPYPHLFEQVMMAVNFIYGGKVGYYQGNPLKLVEDCALIKPTIFPSVPRLYNKIYAKIKGQFD